MLHYHQASAGAVDHCDRKMRCVGAKSYKLVHVLVVHISHLQRTTHLGTSVHSALETVVTMRYINLHLPLPYHTIPQATSLLYSNNIYTYTLWSKQCEHIDNTIGLSRFLTDFTIFTVCRLNL